MLRLLSIVRSSTATALLPAALLAIWLGACGGSSTTEAQTTAPAATSDGDALVAREGTFERRVDLTGSLAAARSIDIQVPPNPTWQVDLRWLAEDGALVAEGDVVAELDDSGFATDLEQQENRLDQQVSELERRRAEIEGEVRERRFAVAQAEAELEKAELEADVPEGIVPRQDFEERRLARDRAAIELEKARAELESYLRSTQAEVEVLEIDIGKARREITTARAAISDLALTAPVSGVFLRGEHPWHGRELQVGDSAWVGMLLGTLPDMSSLVVEARLPDVDDGDVAAGMPARVILDAYPERSLRGVVREIAPVAQEEEGLSTRRFFATLIELTDLGGLDRERLLPGLSARIEVIAERREDALLVPRRALGLTEGTASVHLAGGDTAEVRIGPCDALDCVVEEGIEPGARLAEAEGYGAFAGAGAGGGR